MKKLVLIIICAQVLAISACATVPDNNVDFDKINNIKELEGIYYNYGESEDINHQVYLSKIIWPPPKELEHAEIDTIDVRLHNKLDLEVKAYGNSKLIKESIFYEGKDFELTADGLKIKQTIMPEFENAAGFGLLYIYESLGIDEKGDGKHRSRFGIVGLLYLIPIAMFGYEDVRFRKIGN